MRGAQIKCTTWQQETGVLDGKVSKAVRAQDDKLFEEMVREREEADDEAAQIWRWKYIMLKIEGINSRHTGSYAPTKTYNNYFAFDTTEHHLNEDSVTSNVREDAKQELPEPDANDLILPDIPVEVPDDAYAADDDIQYETLVKLQEVMLQKPFSKDRIEGVDYNDELILKRIKYIKSYCDPCSHGSRTVDCCAHRTMSLELIRDALMGIDQFTQHNKSKKRDDVLINIESAQEFCRTDPGRWWQ